MAASGDLRPTPGIAHKVLNNNVVVTVNAEGREQVLMGRGLGFGLKSADEIDYTKVEKTFVLSSGDDVDNITHVLASAPLEVVTTVVASVEEAERSLGRELGKHLAIGIVDHLSFVLHRLARGIRIPGGPSPELAVLYPQEWTIASQMRDRFSRDLSTDLPPEEVVFITMHLLGATCDEPNGTAASLFRRVQHVVTIVEGAFGAPIDTAGHDYARFILHVKFLLQRLVTQTMLSNSDASFYEFAKHSYPRAHSVAEDVRDYVLAATGSTLTDEEMLYVTVHIQRLSQQLTFPGD